MVLGKILFVVTPENVQPEVAFGIFAPHPTGGRLRIHLRAGGVTRPAIHLIGDRQHDVVCRDGRRAVLRDQPHHWIRVLVSGIIVRRDWHAVRVEPIQARVIQHPLWHVVRARHPERIRSGKRQPLVRGHATVEQRRKLQPVPLASRRRVDRAGRISDRLIGHAVTADVGDQFAGDNELRVDGIVGRQDAENGIITVHAMHAEIVPAE